MVLSDLEVILGASILSIVTGGSGAGVMWLFTGKNKVSGDDCENHRKDIDSKIEKQPIPRNVLTVTDHANICSDRIGPIKTSVDKLESTVNDMRKEISREFTEIKSSLNATVTIKELQGFLDSGLRK